MIYLRYKYRNSVVLNLIKTILVVFQVYVKLIASAFEAVQGIC